MKAGATSAGGPPARPAGVLRGRGRLALAFLLSAALHGLVFFNATWSSGSLQRNGGELLIDARLITESPPDLTAPPTSRPMPALPAAPARALEPVQPVAPPLTPAAPPLLQTPMARPETLVQPNAAPVPVPTPATAAGREGGTTAMPAATSTAEQQLDLPPAPDYHPAGMLDPPPRILAAREPVYPVELKGIEGTVVLRILIGTDGKLEGLQVGRAFPEGVFEMSALNAFVGATFSPGYLAGVPVRSQMIVEVKYTPVNRGAKVSGSLAR